MLRRKLGAQLPRPGSLPAGQEQSPRLTLLLNRLRNLGPLIVSYPNWLAIPTQAPRLWPEPAESKASRDLAPEPAAGAAVGAPFRRGPTRDQSAVGRWPGIRADTSTRHRSHRRRARALAPRPEDRVFSVDVDGRTKRPGHQIRLPVDPLLLCPVPNFLVPSLPVPLSPVPQAPDRRKVLAGARVSNLPKQLDPGIILTKLVLKKMRTADSTLEELVWHRFRLRRNSSSS